MDTERAYTPAGLAAATGTMFAWAAGIVIIKLTTSPFIVVSFWRHGFALPFLVLAWLAAGRQRLPWRAAGFGGLLFSVHQVFHFGALRYSTAAVVTILFALQPMIVGIAGRHVTGEQGSAGFYGWACVAAAGCGLLVFASSGPGEGAQTTPLGTALAVGNLLAFSAYFLATKRARRRTSAAAYMLVMTATSGVVVAALTMLSGQRFGAPEGGEWWLLLALALVPATIGHLLITWAHPRIHAAASSAVNLGVPVIASVGAWILVDEPFGPLQAVGGIVALGGAAIAMRHLPARAVTEGAERLGELAT